MTRDIANTAIKSTDHEGRRAIDLALTDAISATKIRSGRSYSRFVAMMKFVLPVVAGILVMMVFLWPELNDDHAKFQIGIARINAEGADGQILINARYTGIDGANNPYSITAESLTQNSTDEDLVDLKEPKADIMVSGGSWFAIISRNGQYSKTEQILTLFDGVNGFHDMGYEFRTEHALINFKDGSVFGESPVHGQGPFGELKSEGFRIFQSGAKIMFTGRARLLLYPIKEESAK